MNGITDFLYARPSFLEGLARGLDFGGTLQQYNSSESQEEADNLALAMDLEAIGEDMRAALQIFVEENIGSQQEKA